MSLINQVLLDLDRRHASSAHLPGAIRSVLAAPSPYFTLRRIGILLATTLGLGLAALTTLAWPPSNTTGSAANDPKIAAHATLASRPASAMTGLGLDPAHAAGEGLALASTPMVPLPALSLDDQPAVAMPAVASDESAAAPMPTTDTLPVVMVGPPATDATLVNAIDREAGDAVPAAASAPVATLESRLESRLEKRAQPFSPRQRAETEYQRGLGLNQQGQGRESQLAFASALQEDPTLSSARQGLAVAMIGEGRLDDAQTLLDQGLQLNPQDAQLALVLARIKAERQDLPGAIAVLSAALPTTSAMTSRTDAPEARALLATLQQRAGNSADAIENYQRALRQAPTNGAWWIGLGNALTAAGRNDEAHDAYEHARATRSLSAELEQYIDQRLRALTH